MTTNEPTSAKMVHDWHIRGNSRDKSRLDRVVKVGEHTSYSEAFRAALLDHAVILEARAEGATVVLRYDDHEEVWHGGV